MAKSFTDRQRVNWLSKHQAAIYRYGHDEWAVRHGTNYTATTLRAAIDKAMRWKIGKGCCH